MRKTKHAPLLITKRRTHDLILRSSQQRNARMLQNYLLLKVSRLKD